MKKQQELDEWLASLPIEVEDDPRLGLPAISVWGDSGTVNSVYRFPDGEERFSIDTGDGIVNSHLSPDQITIHKP